MIKLLFMNKDKKYLQIPCKLMDLYYTAPPLEIM